LTRDLKALLKAPLRPARNLYYRAVPRLRYAYTGRKHILLYVNNRAMTSHIRRYAEPLLENPAYAFSLYDPGFPLADDPADEFQQFILKHAIEKVERPQRHAWDLIVCADLRTPASFTRDMVPILYVNHGLHIISMDGGETLYCYGDYARDDRGKPRFTAMCEPNSAIAEAMKKTDPKMAEVIHHTGYKFYNDVKSALARREAYRRLLGVSPDTCLVGLFGTWRENSLFHALGEPIFDACHGLRGEGYQFLFSVHPNEYERYDPHIEPMGPIIDAQRERGMLVRDPKEDFAPYMAACDIVISDFSSMAESAILFGRKLAFSPYPDGMVWKRSLTAQARRALPTLESPEGLRFLLHNLRHAPLDPFIAQAQGQLIRPDHDSLMAELTKKLLGLTKEAKKHE
jgi:hypothetical protein